MCLPAVVYMPGTRRPARKRKDAFGSCAGGLTKSLVRASPLLAAVVDSARTTRSLSTQIANLTNNVDGVHPVFPTRGTLEGELYVFGRVDLNNINMIDITSRR
jgi:hypothetical protein